MRAALQRLKAHFLQQPLNLCRAFSGCDSSPVLYDTEQTLSLHATQATTRATFESNFFFENEGI